MRGYEVYCLLVATFVYIYVRIEQGGSQVWPPPRHKMGCVPPFPPTTCPPCSCVSHIQFTCGQSCAERLASWLCVAESGGTARGCVTSENCLGSVRLHLYNTPFVINVGNFQNRNVRNISFVYKLLLQTV